WRRVKEVHDSFKYSSSGLGGGAAIVIAIVVAYFTAGAASAAIGNVAGAAAGSGGTMAAAGTATASAVANGAAIGSTVAAGWGNVALTAVATGAASNTAISTINNRGDLGAILKDVTSEDALRGYVVAGATAGLTNGLYNGWTGTETGASGALVNSGKVITEGGLNTWSGIGQFAGNQLLQNGTSAVLDRALGGDSSLSDALRSSLANTFAAAGFNLIGDQTAPGKWDIKDGSLAKIGLHAVMGGLAAEAAGGDFRTGALAAGVNEALVDSLAGWYGQMDPEQKKSLLVMNSQVIGVLAAGAQGGDEKALQTGAWVAGSATLYNRQLHESEKALAKELAEKSGGRFTEGEVEDVLRVSSRADEGIFPGTDMVVPQDGVYDTGGRWVKYGDTYVQLLPVDIDPDVAKYVLSNAEGYSFHDSTLGLAPNQNIGGSSQNPRDRLTGYALGDSGGYVVPVVIDGKYYQPRFWPCGNAECIAVGANIDFGNADTLRWLRAADAKALDDFSKVMTAGAVIGSGGTVVGLGHISTGASLLSGYLNDAILTKLTEGAVSTGFESYAASRGVPLEVARKITNALSLSGAWSGIVENGKDLLGE
ncbi:MAG TPA: hypothetical protein DEH10_20615, partial [Pseudomonas sp.]|nr:hypothetical protein [Pseudomonas sp.]